ncbi:cell wall hydrolase [Rhizobium sp. HT1-10]|uniref:cell wall hydrolase n=1 Tax=Rhizobium sp. HT1-10 TaxID=3111638 RepID=UPI003C1C1327
MRSFENKPPRHSRNWLSPTVFGCCAWLIFPSIVAQADVAGMLSGIDDGDSNWRMVLTTSPAGSIHQAELAFTNASATGSAEDGGMLLPDGRRIAFQSKEKGSDPRPDEDRVRRRDKKGRVANVVPMAPPKDFTAGSILQRTTLFFRPELDVPSSTGAQRTAFIKDDLGATGLETAFLFSKQEPLKADGGVPPILASLVTNPRADSLAMGYAEPGPDYAATSPFDSILGKEPADSGRFVPQIGAKDHAWAASVLPAEVFSSDEQQCLATGIYFEARGESVKGQAAVAQVILNRVRNPAYPKTICGVVYQNEDWTNACQFSFACDKVKDRVNSPAHWQIARQVAMAVTAGKIWLPEVGSATHYHAVYVKPRWAGEMVKVGRIGMHLFYRTYGGGWS